MKENINDDASIKKKVINVILRFIKEENIIIPVKVNISNTVVSIGNIIFLLTALISPIISLINLDEFFFK